MLPTRHGLLWLKMTDIQRCPEQRILFKAAHGSLDMHNLDLSQESKQIAMFFNKVFQQCPYLDYCCKLK